MTTRPTIEQIIKDRPSIKCPWPGCKKVFYGNTQKQVEQNCLAHLNTHNGSKK